MASKLIDGSYKSLGGIVARVLASLDNSLVSLDDVIRQFRGLRDVANDIQLANYTREMARLLGFEYFTFSEIKIAPLLGARASAHWGCPKQWVETYVR